MAESFPSPCSEGPQSALQQRPCVAVQQMPQQVQSRQDEHGVPGLAMLLVLLRCRWAPLLLLSRLSTVRLDLLPVQALLAGSIPL